jgi:hypothetical protein
MEGDAIQASEFFEARAGSGVDGIAFGDVPEFYDRRGHLLESTGGKKGLSTMGLLRRVQGDRQLLFATLGILRLRCNRREPVRLLTLTLLSSASGEASRGSR